MAHGAPPDVSAGTGDGLVLCLPADPAWVENVFGTNESHSAERVKALELLLAEGRAVGNKELSGCSRA